MVSILFFLVWKNILNKIDNNTWVGLQVIDIIGHKNNINQII